ncbi:MAG: IS110 family transposase [Acidobacteria bacterium]|nr:IS110 family transposase [Acidobacteriota bacterium]
MDYIAFDSHKRYTWASVTGPDGRVVREGRIEHERGALRSFLEGCAPGSPVAVETIGNWYWIVDEIEAAGMVARLVHARKAKVMMGMVNKTDKLDARGLNVLQRAGTLPTVWIPPGELRDQRDLPRTRMMLARERTRLKNRMHASLAKYALKVEGVSDAFGKRGRVLLRRAIRELPAHTGFATELLFQQLEAVEARIAQLEARMREAFGGSAELERIMSLPGVGFILGTVILLEVGDVGRFPTSEHLASYAGTTPRVHSSGGKTRFGRLRPDVNRYLKWAFVEASNALVMQQRNYPDRHVARLYARLRRHKGHQKAVGAVARHLAESVFWVLSKKQLYRDPTLGPVPSMEG